MTVARIGNLTIQVELDVIDIELIRSKTPVDTGNLKNNFRLDIDGNIINPVDYSELVEVGTTSRPGAFMVERSMDEIGSRLEQRVVEQIDKPGLITLPDITLKVGA